MDNFHQMNGKTQMKAPTNTLSLKTTQAGPTSMCLNETPSLSQAAIIKMNGTMVTIRNPLLHQAMVEAGKAQPDEPSSSHLNGPKTEIFLTGDTSNNSKNSNGNKLMKNIQNPNCKDIKIKGKENNYSVQQPQDRFSKMDHFKCNISSECNGHESENGHPVSRSMNHGNAGGGMIKSRGSEEHPSRATLRDAMAVANEAKRNKKKKKKGPSGPGQTDDWNLVGKFETSVLSNLI